MFPEDGLGTDLELNEPWTSARTRWIDNAGEARLKAVIDKYQKQGPEAWQYGNNCSNFASNATGEPLGPKGLFGIPTPAGVSDSIRQLNGGNAYGRVPKP